MIFLFMTIIMIYGDLFMFRLMISHESLDTLELLERCRLNLFIHEFEHVIIIIIEGVVLID